MLTNVYLQFDEEAEEISKNMDLNKVVLRFQAFHFDNSLNCYRPLTRPVDSEMVVNLSECTYKKIKTEIRYRKRDLACCISCSYKKLQPFVLQ